MRDTYSPEMAPVGMLLGDSSTLLVHAVISKPCAIIGPSGHCHHQVEQSTPYHRTTAALKCVIGGLQCQSFRNAPAVDCEVFGREEPCNLAYGHGVGFQIDAQGVRDILTMDDVPAKPGRIVFYW